MSGCAGGRRSSFSGRSSGFSSQIRGFFGGFVGGGGAGGAMDLLATIGAGHGEVGGEVGVERDGGEWRWWQSCLPEYQRVVIMLSCPNHPLKSLRRTGPSDVRVTSG